MENFKKGFYSINLNGIKIELYLQNIKYENNKAGLVLDDESIDFEGDYTLKEWIKDDKNNYMLSKKDSTFEKILIEEK
jgi:hypothetical protein